MDYRQREVAYEIRLWGSGWIIDREKWHKKFACGEWMDYRQKLHMKFACMEVDGLQTERSGI